MAASTLALTITAARTVVPTMSFPISKSYSINEPVTEEIRVAAASTVAIPLGGITTARILMLTTTLPITLTRNAGPTLLVNSMCIFGGSTTSLSATNASLTTEAVVTLFAAEQA